MAPTQPLRQDAWLWRLFATGIAFVLFGLGGIVLRLVVFPLQKLWPSSRVRKEHLARRTISFTFACFIRLLQATGVLTVRITHAERLGQPGQLIIANHPSLLDVVFLISQLKQGNCVVKHSLAQNRYTGGPINAAGYISNDASIDMLDRAAGVLREGETLIIFPEGTRTAPGAMPVFHRGASAIALRGARIITPVVIRMSPPSLTKGEPWYRVPYRRMEYSIEVGAGLDPSEWRDHWPAPIAGRRLNDALHDYFQRALTKK